MRVRKFLGITLALTTGWSGVTTEIVQAIQLGDGTVYFAQPPSLVEATTTLNGVNMWGATYYFTVNLPQTAGEPLQKMIVKQQEGVSDIRFDLEDTRAFTGTRRQKGAQISLKEVTRDRNTKTVSILFDPPVSPGQTVTIGLRPVKNPMYSGVYLFGVTAFPPGEKSHGQFLGFGRLHFYSNGLN